MQQSYFKLEFIIYVFFFTIITTRARMFMTKNESKYVFRINKIRNYIYTLLKFMKYVIFF